jgi:hypothetical protein
MTLDINELVEQTLQEARKTIEAGAEWRPEVHIFHAGGSEIMSIDPVIMSTVREKQELTAIISERMKHCNAILAVMVADAWVATDNVRRLDLNVPFPGRLEALTATVWGPSQPTLMGTQTYSRAPDGKPVFQEFSWDGRCVNRFAGVNLSRENDADPHSFFTDSGKKPH